jgi:hypothetical protein
MPAIRAIYFSTRAHEKKRGSIYKKPLEIKRLASCTASALALLVTRVGRANDVDDAAAAHDFAVLADLLH